MLPTRSAHALAPFAGTFLATIVGPLCTVALLAASTGANAQSPATPAVQLTRLDQGRIEVRLGDQLWTTFQPQTAARKPFFDPVFAPDGTQLTRDIRWDLAKTTKEYDHLHHKGIWIAIDQLHVDPSPGEGTSAAVPSVSPPAEKAGGHGSGLNYWLETHVIRNVSTDIEHGNALRITNEWLGTNEQPVLTEQTLVTFHPDGLMEFRITLTATQAAIRFGDTKEGFLAIRVGDSLREQATGTITGANGDVGEKACWGRPNAWIDYSGTVDGKLAGVTMFDDPANFRTSRYHVRAYGLFAINPFGPQSYSNGDDPSELFVLQPGQPLTLRYGLFSHTGDAVAANIPAAYARFLRVAPAATSP